MRILVGVFRSTLIAELAVSKLRAAGLSDDQLLLLTPKSLTHLQVGRLLVPHPQGSCGITAGHIVGALSGFAGGTLAGAIAALLITEGGPLVTIGALAVASVAGVGVGATAGHAIQKTFAPRLSYEDLLVYEDTLRHGGGVLIVSPSSEVKAETSQQIFTELGVEKIEDVRGEWWHRLRTDKTAALGLLHEGVTATEIEYLRGFEAALNPQTRDLSCMDAIAFLHEQERAVYHAQPFRRGYERGQAYRRELLLQGQREAPEPMSPVVH